MTHVKDEHDAREGHEFSFDLDEDTCISSGISSKVCHDFPKPQNSSRF